MYSTSSVVTFHSPENPKFSFRETLGIFIAEFLLPGSIYCFGALYIALWNRLTVPLKDGLWFPVTAFSAWMITNCCSRRLCKYLQTRRYERVAVTAVACVIVVEKTLVLSCGNHVGKFIAQGLIEGACTSILLTIIKLSCSEYYQSNLSRFTLVSQLTRATSFLFYPSIYELLTFLYGAIGAEVVHGAILAHILPAVILIFCEFKEDEPQKLTTISESLFYQANNLNKDEPVSDSWESNHSESDEAAIEEMQFYARKVNHKGIEILSVIEEESESRLTCSEIPKFQPDPTSNAPQKISSKVAFGFKILLIFVTKFTIVFAFVITLTLLPYLMNESFIFQLISLAWFINTIGLWCVSTPKITKIILFLFGLLWSACCFFYLSPFTMDMAHRISLLFAFGFSGTIHCENVTEEILFKKAPKVLRYLNGLIGTCMILTYTVIYLATELSSDSIFLAFAILFVSILVMWVIIILTKFVCKHM